MENQMHSNPNSSKLFSELFAGQKQRRIHSNSASVSKVKNRRENISMKMASSGQGCSSSESEAPPSSPPAKDFVRSTSLNERPSCPTSLVSIGMEMAEMKKDIKEIKVTQNTICKNIANIMEMLQSIQGVHQPDRVSEVPDVPPIRGPASTIAELDELAAHPSIREHLIMQRSVTLNDTVKRMLRRLMKRELALQFSYSGLGEKRQLTKTAFKYHPAFECVMDALNLCGFHLEDMRTRVVAVQMVLRHAKEWDSSRRKPVKRIAMNGPSDSTVPMPFSLQSLSHSHPSSHPSPHSHPSHLYPSSHSHPSSLHSYQSPHSNSVHHSPIHAQSSQLHLSPQSSPSQHSSHTQQLLQPQPSSHAQSSSSIQSPHIQSSPSQSSSHSMSSQHSQLSTHLPSSHAQSSSSIQSSHTQLSPSQSSPHSISSQHSQLSTHLQSSHYQPPYAQPMSNSQSPVLPVPENTTSHAQTHVQSSLLSTTAEQLANQSPAPPTDESKPLKDDEPTEVAVANGSRETLCGRSRSRAHSDNANSSCNSRNGVVMNPSSFLQIKHEVFDEVVSYEEFEDY